MDNLVMIESIFPPPICLNIQSPELMDSDFETMNEILTSIQNTYNESNLAKINDIYLKEDFYLEPGTFKICIGKEVIFAGEFRDYNLQGVMQIMEGVVTLYNDRIIEQQNKNADILFELEKEGQFLTIYHYHAIFGNTKDAFHYLKKASVDGSRYCKNRLRNYYRRKNNKAMVQKLQTSKGKKRNF